MPNGTHRRPLPPGRPAAHTRTYSKSSRRKATRTETSPPRGTLCLTRSPIWNTLGADMIGVHNPNGTATSPTLISPQRYAWLHAAHSRLNQGMDFLHDLQNLMLRYHPRAETINPQGRKYKPAK